MPATLAEHLCEIHRRATGSGRHIGQCPNAAPDRGQDHLAAIDRASAVHGLPWRQSLRRLHAHVLRPSVTSASPPQVALPRRCAGHCESGPPALARANTNDPSLSLKPSVRRSAGTQRRHLEHNTARFPSQARHRRMRPYCLTLYPGRSEKQSLIGIRDRLVAPT